MHITVTSVATEEVGPILGKLSVEMEDVLNSLLASKTFGDVDRFMVVIVAVDSDGSENNRFVIGHNKAGSYKHPVTFENVKFISFGLPLDPTIIQSSSDEQLRQSVSKALIARLENAHVKIPKSFNYEAFADELRRALELYASTCSSQPPT